MVLACLLCPAALGSLEEYAAHLQEDHRVHRIDVLSRMVALQVQAEVEEASNVGREGAEVVRHFRQRLAILLRAKPEGGEEADGGGDCEGAGKD